MQYMAPARAAAVVVVLTALFAGGSAGAWQAEEVAALIHALRPVLGSGGQLGRRRAGVPCDSWRLAVEAYNKRDWKTVPASCERYVGNYMLGGHYRRDSRAVADEAIAYTPRGSTSPATAARSGSSTSTRRRSPTSPTTPPTASGTEAYNATSFNEYVLEGSAPALPETQRLFKKLISLGIKPVFLTGRTEDQMAITVTNLARQGYSGWEKLLLKPLGLKLTAIAYKSGERQKLVDAGYVIVGNIGDQWRDILGAPEGARTFKLPDPLYYIA
ncbi:hypothetical protein ACP4OV_001959 [Aristida adscensionis]